MAARSWTQEQRERQREAIKRWKPWEHSTGPRSDEGKAKVSRNGWKGGTRRMLRELARMLNPMRRADSMPAADVN
jgi:hypothetical protein